MKNFFPKFIVFALVLLLAHTFAPCHADDPPAPPVVLFTTDFATDPIHATDNRWWVSDANLVTWVQDAIHEGKGSLKLTSTDPKANVVTYGPFIPYAGPSLRLSFEVKLDSVSTGANNGHKAGVAIYYYDKQKHEIIFPSTMYHDTFELPDETQDWQTYGKPCILPQGIPEVAFFRVVVGLPGTGTIWVDKVTVTQGE